MTYVFMEVDDSQILKKQDNHWGVRLSFICFINYKA